MADVKELIKTVRSDLGSTDSKKKIAALAALRQLETEFGKTEEFESDIEEYKQKIKEHEEAAEETAILLDNSLLRAETAEEEAKRLQKAIKDIAQAEEDSPDIDIEPTREQRRQQRRVGRNKKKLPDEEIIVETPTISERLRQTARKSDLRRVLSQFIEVVEASQAALPLLQQYA